MRIINCPIEPIPQRYSEQWNLWFKEQFETDNLTVTTVYGDKTSGKINQGSFLDVIETNKYKNSQLAQILNILSAYRDEETLILFFHDLWNPALTFISYIREGLGLKNLKICGCLHAGSYDEFDFLNKKGMTPWAKYMELGWFNHVVDQIYVATNFHKKLLMETRIPDPHKVVVTGFPLYADFVQKENAPITRTQSIVFPHRLDSEKCPELFDKMSLRRDLNHFKFIKTVEQASNKKQYYRILAESSIAISFAEQETWGIAMQEAVLCGCFPIVPRRLSYEEMYLPVFLYDTFEEAVEKVKQFMLFPPTVYLKEQQEMILKKGRNAIPNIIYYIRNL